MIFTLVTTLVDDSIKRSFRIRLRNVEIYFNCKTRQLFSTIFADEGNEEARAISSHMELERRARFVEGFLFCLHLVHEHDDHRACL